MTNGSNALDMLSSPFSSSSMSRRNFLTRTALLTGTVVGAGTLLDACGSTTTTTSTSAPPVTLKYMAWNNSPEIAHINQHFHSENPNITIQYSITPTDQYETVLKAKLASGDAPDLFGVFPGTKFYPYAKAGYLMDLTSQPWVSRLTSGAKSVATYHDKVYNMPADQNVIGVTYNTKIFSQLGLSVPTTWNEFLQVCDKIKHANIIPLALGIKDQWVDQLIPYAMAPTAIYRVNSQFDQQMFQGQQNFVSSPWTQMMNDYVELNKRGYFNQGVLGTTYNQTIQLMASGKAAMVVNGNWVLAGILQANPSAPMAMFPLPYSDSAQNTWVSAAVGTTMAVSASTKHKAEALRYVQFWARPDVIGPYLKVGQAFSPFSDVTNPSLGPAFTSMQTALKNGSYNFLDQRWPVGVQDAMLKDIQGVFAGSTSIPKMLQDMDSTFAANKAAAS